MRSRRLNDERSPVDLIEESFYLLRRASFGTWGAYCAGTLPFVLVFLYFWSDMARSAFAHERLPTGVVALTVLFLWMKVCHAVFARNLANALCGDAPVSWSSRDIARLAIHQTILQPLGLFLLPLALVLILPAYWAYAFVVNTTVFAANPENDLRSIISKSWKQALLWPHQNHTVLLLYKLFGFVIFLNIMSVFLGGPLLLKILFGIETVFSQSPWAALNSTMLAGAVAVTFLCIDPLIKASYVLRTFYGESLHTGQDLKAELFRVSGPARSAVLAAALMCLASGDATSLIAAPLEQPRSASPAPSGAIDVDQLSRSIDDVIQQREYGWRLPRETIAGSGNRARGFMEGLFEQIEKAFRATGEAIRDFINWIRSLANKPKLPSTGGLSLDNLVETLVVLLGIALVGLIVWMFHRLWQRRDQSPVTEAAPAAAMPDVSDESTRAEQLPEEGWIRLGQDLLQRGELRLALRAFYLSSLAHLAERQLITLARFKSNLDYQRELQRRAHVVAEVPGLFAWNVAAFERSWYGPHEATPELLREFTANTERLRSSA